VKSLLQPAYSYWLFNSYSAYTQRGKWQIAQLPQVESAFCLCKSHDGAIYSLIGGFDFNRNQFNHVTQAWRQPGQVSNLLSILLRWKKVLLLLPIINDAPLVIDSLETGSEPWYPKNFDNQFEGPMRMRAGLIKSKNLVSIRILQA